MDGNPRVHGSGTLVRQNGVGIEGVALARTGPTGDVPLTRADVDVHVGNDVDVELEQVAPRTAGFAALYSEQFLPMVRLATLVGARRDLARDVVQDAFVQVHLRWATVREPVPYLRRCVVNGCRSLHRRERLRRATPLGTESASPVGLDVDHTLAALAVLPHRQRAAVVLKFYEGRTEQEIADVLGCRPGSVGPMVHRALTTLREVM